MTQAYMLFHNARLAVYTLVLALMFTLGAIISPAQESVPPAAYLAANSQRGIELFALYADGSLAETPVLLEGQILYGFESSQLYNGNLPENRYVDVPTNFITQTPQFVDVSDLVLSPNGKRIAFFRYPKIVNTVVNQQEASGELAVLDLTTRSTHVFKKPFNVYPPNWSPDSNVVLFSQFQEPTGRGRVDTFIDSVTGSIIASGAAHLWENSEPEFRLDWPDIYTDRQGRNKLVTLDAEQVGAPIEISEWLTFGSAWWSAQDKLLYFVIQDFGYYEFEPLAYVSLYTVDREGNVSLIVDYNAAFPSHDWGVMEAPSILISADGSIYLFNDGLELLEDWQSSPRWRLDRVENGEIVPVASAPRIDDLSPTGYGLSPDRRYLAITEHALNGTNRDHSGWLSIIELATEQQIIDEETADYLCYPNWIDNRIIIIMPTWPWHCEILPSESMLWHDVISGEQKTISLPDGREFWLIMPQQP